jgi:lipopolysaccharide transport protein LptA
MNLTAKELVGKYTEKNEIDVLTATGDVLITKGPTMKAKGQKAVYNGIAKTVVLTENPEIEQDGSILTADKITIFMEDNRSTAEGQVRVKLVKKGGSGEDLKSLLVK